MRILILLPRIPFPPRDGGSIVMYQTLRELHGNGNHVDVFALNTKKHWSAPTNIADVCTWVDAVDVDTSLTLWGLASSITPTRLPTGFNYNGRVPYWIRRFADQNALDTLRRVVAERGPYDVILCESLFTACYGLALRGDSVAHGRTPVILRAHNVEHQIQARLSRDPEQSWLTRLYRSRLAQHTMSYETEVSRLVDGIVAISDDDARFFLDHRSVHQVAVVTPGVDLPIRRDVEVDLNAICLLGSLDWAPNVHGVQWFIRNVFPTILRNRPGTTVHIAGRGTPSEILAMHNGESIFVYGEIEDALLFRRSKAITVVPLLSGSGVRVKILESLAASRAVVTTSVGCEGLAVQNGKHLLIEDKSTAFAQACLELLNDPTRAVSLADSGRELVSTRYSWKQSNESLMSFMRATIEAVIHRATEGV